MLHNKTMHPISKRIIATSSSFVCSLNFYCNWLFALNASLKDSLTLFPISLTTEIVSGCIFKRICLSTKLVFRKVTFFYNNLQCCLILINKIITNILGYSKYYPAIMTIEGPSKRCSFYSCGGLTAALCRVPWLTLDCLFFWQYTVLAHVPV